jgi:hypothetical protein
VQRIFPFMNHHIFQLNPFQAQHMCTFMVLNLMFDSLSADTIMLSLPFIWISTDLFDFPARFRGKSTVNQDETNRILFFSQIRHPNLKGCSKTQNTEQIQQRVHPTFKVTLS